MWQEWKQTSEPLSGLCIDDAKEEWQYRCTCRWDPWSMRDYKHFKFRRVRGSDTRRSLAYLACLASTKHIMGQ